MSDATKIPYVSSTWNTFSGCSEACPGCRNCWARGMAWRHQHNPIQRDRYTGLVCKEKGVMRWTGKINIFPDRYLLQPLRWRKPRRIAPNWMGDMFHDGVPNWHIRCCLSVMSFTGQHTYLILTKRASDMQDFFSSPDNSLSACQAEFVTRYGYPQRTPTGRDRVRDTSAINGTCKGRGDGNYWPLPNVHPGVSICNQADADRHREPMRKLAEAGWFTWVSSEPRIGPIDWTGWEFIRWLVTGFETGAGAQPGHPDWARGDRDWCQANNVPWYFKSWGEWVDYTQVGANGWVLTRERKDNRYGRLIGGPLDGQEFETQYPWLFEAGNHHTIGPCMARVGKHHSGRTLDGREHTAIGGGK